MAILAHYKPFGIAVEVVDVLTAGSRKRALIRAIEGEPFTACTHGGPITTACAVVLPDSLAEVQQVARPRRRERPYSAEEREQLAGLVPWIGYHWTTSRGGPNGD